MSLQVTGSVAAYRKYPVVAARFGFDVPLNTADVLPTELELTVTVVGGAGLT